MADKGREKGGVAERERAAQRTEGAKVGDLVPGVAARTQFGALPAAAPERVAVASHEAATKIGELGSGKKSSATASGRYKAVSVLDVGRDGEHGPVTVSIQPGPLEEGSLTDAEVEVFLKHKAIVELTAAEAEDADKQLEAAEKAKEMEAERVAEEKKAEAERLAEVAKVEAEKKQEEADAAAARAKSLASGVKKK